MSPLAPPDLATLRLVAGDRSSALVDERASVLWWCGGSPDASPVFWRLLGPEGGAAWWDGVLGSSTTVVDDTVGPVITTELTTAAGRFGVEDVILEPSTLVRTVEAWGGPLTIALLVRLEGFDVDLAPWAGGCSRLGGDLFRVLGGDRSEVDGTVLRVEVDLVPGRPRRLAVCVGPGPDGDLGALVATRASAWDDLGRRALVPKDHPTRALDALRVLTACTFGPTGAVIAAPTTSIPEATGGDRQWDYRYSWLRDASAAASVASRLGQPRVADRYLEFVCERTELGNGTPHTVVTVEGKDLPPERTVDHKLWAGGGPVRTGNAADSQLQVDALGFFGEALWSHRRSGGRVTAHQHEIVGEMADLLVAPLEHTNGIWEFRDPHDLVSAELGRWLLLDRAILLSRLRRPWRRAPARWQRARADAKARFTASLDRDGYAPLAFAGVLAGVPDATGLLAVVFRLLDRDDARAHLLVDATISALGDGPFLRRYPASVDDGLTGTEGAFLPVSWWAVSALATLGRIDEATARADAMCEVLPALMSEEWDVGSGTPLGNTPLVWSHVEAARAFHVLHAARIEDRVGRLGLRAWRIWRYLVVRRIPRP